MARAFISYAREDFAITELLRMKLEEKVEDIEIIIDTANIEGGSEWRSTIDEQIEKSDVLIVVVTEHSVKSDYVQFEWAFAVGRNTKVVPVRFGPVDLPGPLSRYQEIDCTKLEEEAWEKLSRVVQNSAEAKKLRESERTDFQDLQDQVDKLAGDIQTLLDIPDLSAAINDLKSRVKAHKERSGTAQRPAREKKEILWVDDHPSNNVYEHGMFRNLNFNITTALSTEEALDLIARESRTFDVIISDMGRGANYRAGYELLEKLRNSGIDTPFFIYAGSRAPKYDQEVRALGGKGSTNRSSQLREWVLEYA